MTRMRPDTLNKLEFIKKFNVVDLLNFENNILLKNVSFLFAYGNLLFGETPRVIDFLLSPHVAHFGEVISSFTKVRVESIDTYNYLFLITLYIMPKGS